MITKSELFIDIKYLEMRVEELENDVEILKDQLRKSEKKAKSVKKTK